MKIFPSSSIKKLDAYTIENEPITSIDLMERAATVLTKAITCLLYTSSFESRWYCHIQYSPG